FFVFFFQAEDGIRDFHVTGVQTCALPICLRLALCGRGFALHVDAAAEMRSFGDRDAWRDDVAVDRSVVADVDLVAGGHVARDLAEHDDRLREHLGLDAAVGTDRQHMIAQLNRPFDVALDGQILATVQLALDDDGLPNIHDVLLHMLTCLWPRTGGSRYRRRRRLGHGRLPAGRSHRFIAFPHVTFLRLTAPKLGDLPSLLGPKGSGQYRGL